MTFQSILKCLCSLRSPGVSSQRLKVGTKVRFQEAIAEKSEDTKAVKHKHSFGWQEENSNVDVNLLFSGKLLNTVSKTLRSCLEAVLREESKSHLELLTELLQEFYSQSLLNDLLEALAVFGVEDYSECCDILEKDEGSQLRRKCFNMLVLPLFQNSAEHGTAYKEKWLQSLVKLLFVFMNKVEGDDQQTVLETVFQVGYIHTPPFPPLFSTLSPTISPSSPCSSLSILSSFPPLAFPTSLPISPTLPPPLSLSILPHPYFSLPHLCLFVPPLSLTTCSSYNSPSCFPWIYFLFRVILPAILS